MEAEAISLALRTNLSAGASFGGSEEVGLAPTVKLHRRWALFSRMTTHCTRREGMD